MEAVFDGPIKRLDLSRCVTRSLRVDVNDIAVSSIELHVDALRLVEALGEEAGGNEQNQRECRL